MKKWATNQRQKQEANQLSLLNIYRNSNTI